MLLFLTTILCGYAQLIDSSASAETKALYSYLSSISGRQVLFGHQHATEYGHGWQGDADRSDVKSVTGSHPAVIGVDFSGLSGVSEKDRAWNFQLLKKNIEETYQRGGITTVAWHFNNPFSAGGFYWKDSVSARAIPLMLPGASGHDKYKQILRDVARLLHNVKGPAGEAVPLIFRPFHEMDGDWFWWGRSHCKAAEFVALWQFTVRYLRDSLDVHNLIYAFSPDCLFTNRAEYLERYPGDAWVDLLGTDNYADMGRDSRYDLAAATHKLEIVSELAAEKGKLAAFTETGLESIPHPTWWTSVLLTTLKQKNVRVCYVLVWRNDRNSSTHYYAPFPGQASAADFIRFYEDPLTLFENDLQGVYR